MKFTAIIMAGGRGTRLDKFGEKPLVKVGGTEMLKRVASALKRSGRIGAVFVASSRHAPNTAIEARKLGLEVITTPGLGYVEDLRYAVNFLKAGNILAISSDLPFITSSVIDKVCDRYESSKKSSLAVMARSERIRELGFEPSYNQHGLCPVGLNVVGSHFVGDDELEQEVYTMDDATTLVNVNTPEELFAAERLLKISEASQITDSFPIAFKLIGIEDLKEHEEVDGSHLAEIYNRIKSEGFFRKALAADVRTHVVLDGEHRLQALKMLNCKRVPVCLLDYSSEKIEVHTRSGSLMDKAEVLRAALSGKKLPPRTTWHFVRMDDGRLEHISNLEKDILFPISELSDITQRAEQV